MRTSILICCLGKFRVDVHRGLHFQKMKVECLHFFTLNISAKNYIGAGTERKIFFLVFSLLKIHSLFFAPNKVKYVKALKEKKEYLN